jgi:hypothetical protein
MYPDAQDHQESDGGGLELISILPGPLGRTTVATFAGNHVWGTVSSLKALTDTAFAGHIVERLKGSAGRLPPYYQVVIKLRYRDGIPTDASYVTHRVLSLTQNAMEFQH